MKSTHPSKLIPKPWIIYSLGHKILSLWSPLSPFPRLISFLTKQVHLIWTRLYNTSSFIACSLGYIDRVHVVWSNTRSSNCNAFFCNNYAIAIDWLSYIIISQCNTTANKNFRWEIFRTSCFWQKRIPVQLLLH